jgi:hypothetical protein
MRDFSKKTPHLALKGHKNGIPIKYNGIPTKCHGIILEFQ